MENVYHIPAMLTETIEGLCVREDGIYVDATFGGGGHSRAILAQGPKHLYCFDQDEDALRNSAEWLEENKEHVTFVRSNFRYLSNWLDYYGVEGVDGVLADIGVSFHHFDEAERGFSFRFDGPLDMRMNQRASKTAADIVNNYEEEDLARVLYIYGELRESRQLARKIVKARPLATISDLVGALIPSHKGDDMKPAEKHVLTCVFQALRIEVNDELGALRDLLEAAAKALKPGGRIAILSYHSLEDRIVKNFLKSGNIDGKVEKDFYGNPMTPFRLVEKGLTPSAEEVARNPRSRSAKLRVAERVYSKKRNI